MVELPRFIITEVRVCRVPDFLIVSNVIVIVVVSKIVHQRTGRAIDGKVNYKADVLPIFQWCYQRGWWFKARRLVAIAIVEAKRRDRQFGSWCLQFNHKIVGIEQNHGTSSLECIERRTEIESAHKIAFLVQSEMCHDIQVLFTIGKIGFKFQCYMITVRDEWSLFFTPLCLIKFSFDVTAAVFETNNGCLDVKTNLVEFVSVQQQRAAKLLPCQIQLDLTLQFTIGAIQQ